MAKAFKPSISQYIDGKSKTTYFKTFAELKKNLRQFIDESDDGKVNVCRHRRGEWGEWFEVYEKLNNKLIITKQTWL
jgi:hypothetical protein